MASTSCRSVKLQNEKNKNDNGRWGGGSTVFTENNIIEKIRITAKGYIDVTQTDVSSEFRGDQFSGKSSVSASNHGFSHVPARTQYGHCKDKIQKHV